MYCDACRNPFDDVNRRPKMLPCAHTFCLTCMRHHTTKTCPNCRKRFKPSPDLLPDNVKLIEAVDVIRSRPAVDSNVSTSGMCGVDSKEQAATQMHASTSVSQRTAISTQTTPEQGTEDKKNIKFSVRFWCLECETEAGDECLEKHRLCNLRLLWLNRLQQAQPDLDALSQSEDALTQMQSWMDAATRNLEEEMTDIRGLVEKEMLELQQKRSRLEDAAQNSDAVVWEEVKNSIKPTQGLSTEVTQLLANIGDKSTCSVALDDEVQWVATVPAAEDPFAKLFLCRLLCKGGLKQRPVGSLDKKSLEQPERKEGQTCEEKGETCKGSSEEKVETTDGNSKEIGQTSKGNGEEKDQTSKEEEREDQDLDVTQWEEQSNTVDQLSVEEMASRVRVGSKVRRGRDWQGPAHGTFGKVMKVADGVADVHWAGSGRSGTYALGVGGKFCLQLLTSPLVDGWSFWSFDQGRSINLLQISYSTDIKMKTDLLTSGKLKDVLTMLTLCCTLSPGWAKQVLLQVSGSVQNLVVKGAQLQHLEVIRGMPQLRKLVLLGDSQVVTALPEGLEELYLQTVSRAQLLEIAKMASIKRLEVRCPFSDPITDVDFPEHAPPAGLRWLRCGLYPLRTAVRLLRAHRATLEVLELEAASKDPYGCPDLAAELRRCRLQSLRRLIFLRETGRKFCRHDRESCRAQKLQVWDTLMTMGVLTTVECSLCDNIIAATY